MSYRTPTAPYGAIGQVEDGDKDGPGSMGGALKPGPSHDDHYREVALMAEHHRTSSAPLAHNDGEVK